MVLKAVIFDMDGVLTATVEYHYLSWKKVSEEHGFPFNRKVNEKLLGLTRRRSLEVILGDQKLPETQMQEILQRKNEVYLGFVRSMKPSDLMPGAAALLKELHSAGIRVGVASASRNTRLVLARLGILDSIDAISDGNTIHHSKPAPDAFRQAARSLQVQPGESIAIEDSAAGVQAAQAAGICVVGLGSPQQVGQAAAVFPNLPCIHLDDLRAIHRWWLAGQPIELLHNTSKPLREAESDSFTIQHL